jgi:hypothetical protein
MLEQRLVDGAALLAPRRDGTLEIDGVCASQERFPDTFRLC